MFSVFSEGDKRQQTNLKIKLASGCQLKKKREQGFAHETHHLQTVGQTVTVLINVHIRGASHARQELSLHSPAMQQDGLGCRSTTDATSIQHACESSQVSLHL